MSKPLEISGILKLLAPYLAVTVLYVTGSGWLGILVYHAQMILWSRRGLGTIFHGWQAGAFFLVAVPALAAGPVTYFLLPYVTQVPVADWLGSIGVGGWKLALMVPYFGLVNPLLEEAYWSELRPAGWSAHLAFAGYHALVLVPFMQPLWLIGVFALLAVASVIWDVTARRCGGALVPGLSHAFADLGIVLAAWFATR